MCLRIGKMLAPSRSSRKEVGKTVEITEVFPCFHHWEDTLSCPARQDMYIAPVVIPESWCGFKSGRGTMAMIFCLRQTQEKCIGQNMSLYAVFIEFTKAFDTVSRNGPWQILTKFECPAEFANIIKPLHAQWHAGFSGTGNIPLQ